MEQYWMSRRLDWVHLRMCIDHYRPSYIFVRKVGSMGGKHFVTEKLGRKKLDFTKDKDGLHFLVDGKEVVVLSLRDHGRDKGFSLAYERFWPDGTMSFDSHGRDPDVDVPRVRDSMLRHVIDNCLVEITFPGKIPLKFHRWACPDERTWKLYRIENQ